MPTKVVATTPKEIRLELVIHDALLTRRGLRRMLSALAKVDLAPTHAGMREWPKEEFALDAFVERVAMVASTSSMPSFVRGAKPRYTGFFNPQKTELSFLSLTFPGDPGKAPYVAADALAASLSVEFGFVHPIFEGAGRPWNRVANTTAWELQRYGIEGVCARTYFGPHLVSLVGAKKLAAVGARSTKRGAILDLAPHPWTVELDVLKRRQREVTPVFDRAGVIGDLAENIRGKRWKPAPTR